MYEKIINGWIEALEIWADSFEQEKELCRKAADPYPPEQGYINQCDEDIKACARAVDALRELRDALAEPKPEIED